MSQWTHVAGIIRFDGLFGLLGMPEPNILQGIPEGSEGPLDCKMWNNPNHSHIAARTAYIFGDLRNYGDEEDIQRIIDYFERIIKDQMVRDACYTINVEYGVQRTFIYKTDYDECSSEPTFKGFVEVFESC